MSEPTVTITESIAEIRRFREKLTVATGAIGEQIKAAGGPEALKFLLGDGGYRTSNAELRTSNFESDQIELGEPVPLWW